MRIALSIVAGIVLIAILAVLISTWFFGRRVRSEMQQMAATAAPPAASPATELAELPAPVQRYFAFAGVLDHAPVRLAYMRHGGTFRASVDGAWMPIVGEELFSVNPPGFVWKGVINMAPGVAVTARDYYIAPRGNMLIRALGLVTIDDAKGPAVDQGSMMRYFAEIAWLPTALLPGPHVQWKAIDDTTARLIVSDAEHREELTVAFDAEGWIVSITSPARTFKSGNVERVAPWGGVYSDYREVDGLQIPFSAEVIWHFPEGDLSYARFELTEVLFDAAAAAVVAGR
jgi:hypothetical protein